MTTELNKIIDYLEDLKSDEVKRWVIAVWHLSEIAKVFGPDKTW